MTTFLWILLGGILMSTIALVGSVTLVLRESMQKRLLLPLVAFAAGSLIASIARSASRLRAGRRRAFFASRRLEGEEHAPSSSDSGTYFADGVQVGSTLARTALRRPGTSR